MTVRLMVDSWMPPAVEGEDELAGEEVPDEEASTRIEWSPSSSRLPLKLTLIVLPTIPPEPKEEASMRTEWEAPVRGLVRVTSSVPAVVLAGVRARRERRARRA